jgi:hypothetical protein
MRGQRNDDQARTIIPAPVWLSNIDHLQRLLEIHRNESFLTKVVGLYRIPDGFPHLWYWLAPFARVPIIYFANGRLILLPQGFRFEPVHRALFMASVANVRSDLVLEIRRDDIRDVNEYMLDPAELPFPTRSYYNFPWTRVRTRLPGVSSDFLIGAGGAGPSMRGIRARNAQLLETLTAYAPG